MNNMQNFPEGTFCWVELATTDPEAAKKFYKDLFNYEMKDTKMEDGNVYTEILLEGKPIAGLYKLMPDQIKNHIPPHWGVYIAVNDIDNATEKAKSLGAEILLPPMKIMDIGTMAVIKDPVGAIFLFWQAEKFKGAELMYSKVQGSVGWFENMNRDKEKTIKFYKEMFGWQYKEYKMQDDFEYIVCSLNGKDIAGIMPITKAHDDKFGEIPPNWGHYFDVKDCNEITQKAEDLGAKILIPTTEIENMGHFAVIQDPQGAVFDIMDYIK